MNAIFVLYLLYIYYFHKVFTCFSINGYKYILSSINMASHIFHLANSILIPTNSMAFISFTTAHRWNSLLCPPLGFFFNTALIWLILRRTPKEMRVHSRILLQTCATDCLLLIFQCIGQMVYISDMNASLLVYFFDGYLVRNFRAFQHPLFLFNFPCLWLGIHFLSIFGIGVQFVYRYLVLNRGMKVSLRRYFLLIAFPVLYMTGWTSIKLVMGIAILNVNQQPIDRHRFEPFMDFDEQQGQQPIYFAYSPSTDAGDFSLHNLLVLLDICNCALSLLFIYAIICICGWKMIRFVNKNVTLQGRLKELIRQLTKCLIILAFFPLCILIISELVLGDFLFGKDSLPLEWRLYSALAWHWLPVLNPLVAIYTNRPYRDAIFGRLLVRIAPATN